MQSHGTAVPYQYSTLMGFTRVIYGPSVCLPIFLRADRTAWAFLQFFKGLRVKIIAGVFEETPENREIVLREVMRPPPTNDNDVISTKPLLLPTLQKPEMFNETFSDWRFRAKPWRVYNVMMIIRLYDFTAKRLDIDIIVI